MDREKLQEVSIRSQERIKMLQADVGELKRIVNDIKDNHLVHIAMDIQRLDARQRLTLLVVLGIFILQGAAQSGILKWLLSILQ